MKAAGIKTGEIFTIDHSNVRPKLKIKQGFVDIATQYIYVNKEEVEATLCTERDLYRIRQNWGVTLEEFEKYKQKMVKRYITK